MMTSMMSRLGACVALVGLVGCEAGALPGAANDMHRLNIGGGQVDQSDGKTFVAAEVTGALNSGSIDQIFGSNDPAIYQSYICLLYTSPSPRDATLSRMPSSA